jgi:hypothetical protein
MAREAGNCFDSALNLRFVANDELLISKPHNIRTRVAHTWRVLCHVCGALGYIPGMPRQRHGGAYVLHFGMHAA